VAQYPLDTLQGLQVAPTAINEFDERAQSVAASTISAIVVDAVEIPDVERFHIRCGDLIRRQFGNRQL
jgi:hypothetical protein